MVIVIKYMPIFFKTLGALGMVLLAIGIVNKNNLTRNWLFTVGGMLLLAYSIFLRDPIFIPLQIIFTSASIYEIHKLRRSKGKLPIAVSTDEVIRLETGQEVDE